MDELEKSVEELLRLRETWIPENTRLNLELLMADPVSAFPSGYDFTSLIREVVRSSEEKPEKMSERVNHILELATKLSNSPSLSAQQKAKILLLKGKTLNATAALTQISCDIRSTLERALKLEPKLADAWCEIGEVEWMTIGPEAAISSFANALKIDVSFRLISEIFSGGCLLVVPSALLILESEFRCSLAAVNGIASASER